MPMLAFFITVSVMMHGHPVKFHHVSHERFGDEDACMDKGRLEVKSIIARIKRYHKLPTVKVKLDCDEAVTFES